MGRLSYLSASGTQLGYDGTDIIGESGTGDGPLRRRYVHGPGTDEPLVWYEGTGDRRYLHADERGSIVAVSDNAGKLTAINTYDEYGKPGAGNVGRFQYTGQAWLPEAGVYSYKARMYDPRLGRFMQTDPIGYEDGMNLYAYVGGDPINFTDSNGLERVCIEVRDRGPSLPGREEGDNIVVEGRRLGLGLITTFRSPTGFEEAYHTAQFASNSGFYSTYGILSLGGLLSTGDSYNGNVYEAFAKGASKQMFEASKANMCPR